MITGKGGREHFAELGIKNFLEQKDSYKKLLIINHGKKSLIDKYPFVNIEEIMTDETNLGKLRNIALEHIEENSLFCPWDDDDIRHPNFLTYLRTNLVFPFSAVFLKRRFEYNLNTNYGFSSYFENGMPVFLGFKKKNWKYLEKETLEDVNIIKDLDSLGYKFLLLDNEEYYYTRIIHRNNTSPYVKKNKVKINNYSGSYKEFVLSEKKLKMLMKIISLHFP